MARKRMGRAPKDLGRAIEEGHQPMFMTPNEILEHLHLADAPSPYRKKDFEDTLAYKLEDAKHPLSYTGKTSLFSSIKRGGIRKPLEVQISPYVEKPQIVDGHHRLAVAHNLNPNQFVPLTWSTR